MKDDAEFTPFKVMKDGTYRWYCPACNWHYDAEFGELSQDCFAFILTHLGGHIADLMEVSVDED